MRSNDSKKNNIIYFTIQIFLDISIILISYWFAFNYNAAVLLETSFREVMIFLAQTAIVSGLIFTIYKPYKCGEKPYVETIFDLALSIVMINIIAVFVDYIFKGVGAWRRTVFVAGCIQVIVLAGWKWVAFKLYHKLYPLKSAIVVGEKKAALALSYKLLAKKDHLIQVKYIVYQEADIQEDMLIDVDEVFICAEASDEIKKWWLDYCMTNEKTCHIAPKSNSILLNSSQFTQIGDMPTLTMTNYITKESKVAKRVIDIVISAIGLILSLPFMLIAVIGIKIQDGGPIIYSQQRVSENNHIFKVYKFRTMIENAEAKTGAVLSSGENDPRITAFGRFMRATRIDELPQLFNVLLGHMSMIGPRPERPEMIEKIVKDVPEFKHRTKVKAGLTGLAQVMGKYNTTFNDKLMFDLYYIRNYSILLDIKILFYTIRVVFMKSATEGALDEDEDYAKCLHEKGYKLINEKFGIRFI